MMTRTVQFVLLLLLSTVAGCSLQENVEQLYQKETPLEVHLILPEHASAHSSETIQAILTQEGKRVEHADFVHFEIWKKDGSVQYGMETAQEDGNGTYSLRKAFKEEGLYIVKVHASSKGSVVMPRKQLIVGKLSEEELQSLEGSEQKQAVEQGHSH